MTDCVTDPVTGCVTCPYIPAHAAIPPRVDTSANFGWNVGADSIAQRSGDVHTVFQIPAGVTGAFVGFKTSRLFDTDPTTIDHALYFMNAGGVDLVTVYEFGVPVTSAASRLAADSFEIVRRRGLVTYNKNGTVLYVSTRPYAGDLIVNACLYGSGDAVL